MVVGSAGAVVYLSKELDAVVCLSELTVWEELEDCVRLSFGGSFLATLLWRFRLCGIVLFVCAFGLSVRQSVCLVLFRSVPFVFLEFLNLCFAQGGAPRVTWKKKTGSGARRKRFFGRRGSGRRDIFIFGEQRLSQSACVFAESNQSATVECLFA